MSDHRHRAFWDEQYRTGDTRWQLERAAPPLVRLLGEVPPRDGIAVVVGCGRGHEPLVLAAKGVRTIGLDFSPLALSGSPRAPGISHVAGDVRRIPFRTGSIETVIEHTCYCAIDPSDRRTYEDEVARVLRPGGRIYGLFFEPANAQNPPFRTTDDDVRRGFSRAFAIERLERPADSHPNRAGREWLALLRRI